MSLLTNPFFQIGQGLMRSSVGPTPYTGISDGLLNVQRARNADEMIKLREQMAATAQQRAASQASEDKRKQEKAEAASAYVSTLPPAEQAIAAAMGPEKYAELKQKKAMGIGVTEAPASVREWEYFNSLDPEQQQQYLGMKRSGSNIGLGGHTIRLDASGNPVQQFQHSIPPEQLPEAKAAVTTAVADATSAAEDRSKAGQKAADKAKLISSLRSVVEDEEGMRSIYGPIDARTMDVSPTATTARAKMDNVISQLSLESREKMKGSGQISDFEAKLLGKAATILSDYKISDEEAIKQAEELLAQLEGGATAGGWSVKEK